MDERREIYSTMEYLASLNNLYQKNHIFSHQINVLIYRLRVKRTRSASLSYPTSFSFVFLRVRSFTTLPDRSGVNWVYVDQSVNSFWCIHFLIRLSVDWVLFVFVLLILKLEEITSSEYSKLTKSEWYLLDWEDD